MFSGIVKGESGNISYSRFTGFLIIIVNLGASIMSIYKGTGAIDIPFNWALLAASLYGLNKFGNAIFMNNSNKTIAPK